MSAPIVNRDCAKVLTGKVFLSLSPSNLRLLVSQRVVVICTDGKTQAGLVFTVDPVSKSIVLVQFPDEQSTITKIIMGHAVESITVGTEAITSQTEHRLSQLFRLNDPHKNLSEEETARRKTELKQWLEQHHIPVTISGDKGELLNIAEALYIEPPYGLDNCISANEIILGRVQALMKNKPERLDTKEVTLNEEET
ncbi:gem-associated protein 6-like [Asterias rubens]|uniref:gem-associated protein 6-like n=1 Tax=Asterias rubens TaxID=7604 RepID=UPI001455B60F|nr:gem-associated protein 6-like [Asterias rubens]